MMNDWEWLSLIFNGLSWRDGPTEETIFSKSPTTSHNVSAQLFLSMHLIDKTYTYSIVYPRSIDSYFVRRVKTRLIIIHRNSLFLRSLFLYAQDLNKISVCRLKRVFDNSICSVCSVFLKKLSEETREGYNIVSSVSSVYFLPAQAA